MVLVIGLAWFSVEGGDERDIAPLDIPSAVADGDPVAMVDLGIILLIATPALGLAAAAGGLLMEGDRRYAMVAAMVLLVAIMAMMI